MHTSSLTLDGADGAGHATAPPAEAAKKVTSRRAVVAAAIGNGMEIYDFTVYSFFAATIGRLFFPAHSALASLLLSFATFGAGFVMRPLGAMLIGSYADRRGRKPALTLTIALMTAGTALIAFTPGYATIGVAGTVLLVVGRLLQGLSAGGEVGAASALLLESATAGRRCFLVSWQGATQGAAALLGALVGASLSMTLSAEALGSWGWRVPFMLGLLIAPVGVYLRRHLDETHVDAASEPDTGLVATLRAHGRTVLLGMFLIAGTTVSMYLIVFYMPTYLVTALHLPTTTAFIAACVAGATMLVMSPLFGALADRYQLRKSMMVTPSALAMLLAYPAFSWLIAMPSLATAAIVVGVGVTLMSVGGGAGGALVMEAFPRRHRATGMSVMYSLSVTIFGGFSPLIVTWLIGRTGSPLAPAFYLIAAQAISLLALWLYPQPKHAV